MREHIQPTHGLVPDPEGSPKAGDILEGGGIEEHVDDGEPVPGSAIAISIQCVLDPSVEPRPWEMTVYIGGVKKLGGNGNAGEMRGLLRLFAQRVPQECAKIQAVLKKESALRNNDAG